MSGQRPVIVVGVASLEEEDSVLRPAVELAQGLGGTLHVVHAFGLPEPIQAAYARRMVLTRQQLERVTAELQAQLEAQVRACGGGSAVCHVVEGAASQTLASVAGEVGAELLVVGATRRSRIWRQLLGTTAEAVIRRAEIPVLVLRQPLARGVQRVLYTTDLSSMSAQVYEDGRRMTEALFGSGGLQYRALLAVQYEWTMPLKLSHELLAGIAAEELQRFLRGRSGGAGDVDGRVRIGEPADEILSEAAEWGADLVILGTRGQPGLDQWLLGSVAGSVLRAAGCNVLIVPGARRAAAAAQRSRSEAVEAPVGASAGKAEGAGFAAIPLPPSALRQLVPARRSPV